MKTYKIGRGADCQIALHDEKISRNHALLRVHRSGKMEIVDLSQNGTFVNGMRIPLNTAYPVKRKDVVTFAYAEKLNWSKIPNPIRQAMWYGIGCVFAIIFIVGGIALYNCHCDDSSDIKGAVSSGSSSIPPTVADSSKTKKNETEKSEDPQKKFNFPENKKTKQAQNSKDNKQDTKTCPKKESDKKPQPSTGKDKVDNSTKNNEIIM